MDKRFLDPRRPKGKPTAEDQAEMLAPFEPEIPILPGSFVSHRWRIARVAGRCLAPVSSVHCRQPHTRTFLPAGFAMAPAALESTSLALAFGLDVFMTRVQPSRTFDLIPDDFPYGFLLTITLVLGGVMLALRRLEGRMSTSRKWA